MERIALLFLASISLALPGCTGSRPGSVEDELGRLQGSWVHASGGGDIHLQIAKDRSRFTAEGESKSLFIPGGWEGTIKLDPTTSPGHFDIVSEKGTTLGIYKLDGDQLVLVLSLEERARPPDFGKSTWGNEWVFQRVKQ